MGHIKFEENLLELLKLCARQHNQHYLLVNLSLTGCTLIALITIVFSPLRPAHACIHCEHKVHFVVIHLLEVTARLTFNKNLFHICSCKPGDTEADDHLKALLQAHNKNVVQASSTYDENGHKLRNMAYAKAERTKLQDIVSGFRATSAVSTRPTARSANMR